MKKRTSAGARIYHSKPGKKPKCKPKAINEEEQKDKCCLTAQETVDLIKGDPDALADLALEIDTTIEDTVVTYTFPYVTDPDTGDVTITATGSDGSLEDIVITHPPHPEESDGVHLTNIINVDEDTGIVTFNAVNDGDESVAPPSPIDLGFLISTPHPERPGFVMLGDGGTANYNPDTNNYELTVTPHTVDTDTWDDVVMSQTTDPDTGVVTTTWTVTPAEGGTPVVTTISTIPCVNKHPTFIARCNASAGTGSPIDRYIIDASLTTGDKVIEFLPLGDYSAPTNDDPWIFVTNNDVGFITDTQFLTQGGYIRVGVETDCGTKWDIQKFEPCCDDVEGKVIKGNLVGVASFCLGVEVSPTSSYIQLDEYVSPLTPDKTMPYLGGSVTNNSNCTKCYTVRTNTNVNRANELGALGGPFAGIPDAIATVQTRLGFVGDPLLDDPFADILYFTTNSTIWDSVERDIEEETSGRIKNSYYNILGAAPNEGVSTFNKNELDFCLAPGETADLEAKTHIYYWEDEDGEVPVSQERIHFEGNMFITERT